jgi:uncharacterized protein YkwD
MHNSRAAAVIVLLAIFSISGHFAAEITEAAGRAATSPAAMSYVDAEGNTGIESAGAVAATREAGPKLAPTDSEAEVIALLNTERAAQGIAPLVENGLLTNAARRHSNDMAQNMGQNISHDGTDGSTYDQRITEAGYNWTTCGENIAAGYGSAAATVAGWMGSPGHRANILNPAFREIGAGYVYDAASYYGDYYTTDFGASSTSPTPGPTPVPGTNCINLAAGPLELNPGESVTLAFSCLAEQYGFIGVPLNVYVAAIRDPLVIDGPSTVDQALGGGAVYIFGPNMASAYLYTGRVRGPAFSNVTFTQSIGVGSLRVNVPPSPAYSGTYVFAAALVNRATGQFIRADLPVDNSNSFRVR